MFCMDNFFVMIGSVGSTIDAWRSPVSSEAAIGVQWALLLHSVCMALEGFVILKQQLVEGLMV